MKTKSKIFIFICAFALIFSLVSVSSFAAVSLGNVTFSETLNTNSLNLNSSSIDGINFTCYNVTYDNVYYNALSVTRIAFSYRGYWAVDFVTTLPESEESVSITAYSNGWTQESFRNVDFIFCSDDAYLRLLEVGFISEDSPDSSSDSFYNQIFNSISGAVFGGAELTPEQNLSLSLISTVLSIGMVLLPVLLAIGFLLRCFRL